MDTSWCNRRSHSVPLMQYGITTGTGGEFYRLMVTKGYEQLVLSVKGAKKIATIDRFDNLIKNVVPDESSPDLSELRKLIDIKMAHESYTCRLFPKHNDWI